MEAADMHLTCNIYMRTSVAASAYILLSSYLTNLHLMLYFLCFFFPKHDPEKAQDRCFFYPPIFFFYVKYE